jgi:hypothetical protein
MERFCFGCRFVGKGPFRSWQKIGRWAGVCRLRGRERPELELKEGNSEGSISETQLAPSLNCGNNWPSQCASYLLSTIKECQVSVSSQRRAPSSPTRLLPLKASRASEPLHWSQPEIARQGHHRAPLKAENGPSIAADPTGFHLSIPGSRLTSPHAVAKRSLPSIRGPKFSNRTAGPESPTPSSPPNPIQQK